jgi:hypothetical protein
MTFCHSIRAATASSRSAATPLNLMNEEITAAAYCAVWKIPGITPGS